MDTPNSAVARTTTSTFLLEGLRDPTNSAVWREFVQRYRPLIVSYARRAFGVSTENAEDAAQAALAAFAQSYREGRYDREAGRLRKWLFGIATNQIKKTIHQRARAREIQVGGDSGDTGLLGRIPDVDRLQPIWEREWELAVFRHCMDEVRGQLDRRTVEAFELFAWQGWPAVRVAELLDMTENAVYLAKQRVLRRVQRILPRVQEVW